MHFVELLFIPKEMLGRSNQSRYTKKPQPYSSDFNLSTSLDNLQQQTDISLIYANNQKSEPTILILDYEIST